MTDKTNKPKGKKSAGPLRLGVIIPLLIISALVYVYFLLFFDDHARRGLAYAASQAVRAEVNIDSFTSSFVDASWEISNIQVTDAEQPARNLLQIDSVRGQLLWDALLRGKVVIDEASITGVGIHTSRAEPGYVLPPPPPGEGPSVVEGILANTGEHFNGNILGDLAAIASGADPTAQLGDVGDSLAANQRLDELRTELELKQGEWQQRIDGLPQGEELKAFETRFKRVKLDGFKNLAEVKQSRDELKAIEADLKTTIQPVKDTSGALSSDVSLYKKSLGDIDDLAKQDIQDLGARLKLPKLDAANLSSALIGPEFMQQVAEARGYMEQAREYLPPPQTAEEKAARRLKSERSKGTDYRFGRPNSYPLFWLKHARITSRSDGAGRAQLDGSIRDLSSDARSLGRPMVAQLQGSLPAKGIHDAHAELMIDRSGTVPLEHFVLELARYPVAGRKLAASDEASLGFAQATGNLTLTAELRGDQVDIRSRQVISDIAYQVDARNATMRAILSGVAADMETVNMDASATGTWDDLDWSLASNLGGALQRAFSQQFQHQIDQSKAKVAAMVNERVAAQRQRLEARYADVESGISSALTDRQAEVKRLETELEKGKERFEKARLELENRAKAEVDKARKAQEQRLKDESNKAAQDLRKRLSF